MEDTQQQETNTNVPTPETSKEMSTTTKVVIGIGILAVLGFGYMLVTGDLMPKNTDSESADILDRDGTGPVAHVNGIPVERAEYLENVTLYLQNAEQQGADVTDPALQEQIKQQVLDSLISTTILLSAATAANLTVNEADVDAEISIITEQMGGEEQLQIQLQNVGLTEEKLRSNITDQLLMTAYINAETDVETLTATDEEIVAFYNEISANAEEGTLPPLADIRSQIETQILAEKQQEVVDAFLASLQENAEIEIAI
jgi:hypothetical protein